jgi:lipopolysaccharide biosynthesis protein
MVNAARSQGRAEPPKILAFVLPQYHPIPENDEWWGQGFTEWTNVRKARPLFPGHLQPRVPADGRYYDLLDPATQEWQASLAKEHGIHGFCYYHYWFRGKRLLDKPVELLLQRSTPDFPFCLAWANEPWTRAWDGGDREVLMPQEYADRADWEAHFECLLRIFSDPRYIRVDGKPMLLIYRSASISCAEPMLQLWRELASRAGLPGLHIVSMLTAFPPDPRTALFDAFADFEPAYTQVQRRAFLWRKKEKFYRKFRKWSLRLFGRANGPPNSYDYPSVWQAIAKRPIRPRVYPGAFVDWDNTPRRGLERGIVFRNFDERAFASGFREQLRKTAQAGVPFLFINAWNEWAEGAYLEPDEARGTFFLDTIRDAVEEVRQLHPATAHSVHEAAGSAVPQGSLRDT